MGEVLRGNAGDASLVAACDFFKAPLVLDQKQAECFVEKRRLGIANFPGTMPIAGISSPVTVAGTVTVAVAELIAGWVLGYVVAPEVPAGGLVASGSLDMRTTGACFASPEALLQDLTVVQLCRRLYGIEVAAVTGYVDCKAPGLIASFQKMYPLLATPFGTSLTIGDNGLLSAGEDYCRVQHLLDAEINGAIRRFWGGFEINRETIALDLIERIVEEGKTNFLDTDHTLRNFKGEQWYPSWFDRRPWQGDAVERKAEHEMLEGIDRYCQEAIDRYCEPEIDRSKLRELESIFLSAEREILGKNVTEL
jgi:trimethylamine--corrinoid protein Co-methyltransferase